MARRHRRASASQGTGRVFRRPYYDRSGHPRLTSTWYLEYYAHGRQVRMSAGTEDEMEARQLLLDKMLEAKQAAPVTRGAKATYEDLEKLLLAYYRENHLEASELVASKSRFPALRSFFGGKLLSEIDKVALRDYRRVRAMQKARGRANKISNATINRELLTLRHGFKLALEEDLVRTVPAFPQKLNEDGGVRSGFFEKAELAAVLPYVPPHLRNLIRVAYITGWRLADELLSREWDKHVDFDGKELRLFPGEAKDRSEGRVFPLLPQLHAVLKDQRAIVTAMENGTYWPTMRREREAKKIRWVFPGRLGERLYNIQHPWQKARAAAGLPRKLVHDFRRTAVRNLVRGGVPRKTAMEMVGHKTEEMFRRYNIVDYKDVQDAGEKLSVFLADVP